MSHSHTHTHTHTHTHVYIYVCVCVCVCMYMCVCVYIHTYLNACDWNYFLKYYYYYYYYYYFTHLRAFPTSFSWSFSTGSWVTASLLKSPGLSLVFPPSLTMLLFWWSPLVLLFASSPVLRVIVSSYPIIISITVGTAKSTIRQILSFFFSFFFLFFFFLLTIWSGRLIEIRWSVYILKSQRIFWMSFSRRDSRLLIYHLFVYTNFNFLHNFQWVTFPTQLYLILYSFCANLLHSLIPWFIVSSLSPQSLHLLFCCDLSIIALT